MISRGNPIIRRRFVLPFDILSSVLALIHSSISVLFVTVLLIIGGLLFVPFSLAEDSDLELVPEPWVHETHEYSVPIDVYVQDSGICNEKWSIEVKHGDVMTLIETRNISQNDQTSVDCQCNIHYTINGTQYIAQFSINEVALIIGNQEMSIYLTTCEDFELSFSPIHYNGTVPTLECNITYKNLQVNSGVSRNSTFDLTLCYRISADWNQTDIKLEALFDFGDTRLYDIATDNEFDAGEPFAAEVRYMMMLHKAHAFGTEGPVIPTSHTNTTLEYDMTFDNGMPVTISKLNMSNAFTVLNGTGSYSSVGYSSTDFGAQSQVIHGFPDLIYKDTLSMRSDPEITVFHDRVTENGDQNFDPNALTDWLPIVAIGAVGAIAVLGVAILVVRRKKKGQ